MTFTAAPEEPADLPRWWWARGLSLRERLAAPRPPLPGPSAAPAAAPSFGTVGDPDALAARLGALGLGAALAGALGEEMPEQLGARAAEPRWARYMARAVAAMQTTDSAAPAPLSVTPDFDSAAIPDGAVVFEPALRALITPAWADVVARTELSAHELSALRSAFEQRLGRRLTTLAARTLVKELSLAKAEGRLSGATPEDRFAAFIAGLGTKAGLCALLTRYPVLARMLGQAALFAADAMVELAERLHADRTRLVTELFDGEDPGALIRVELGCGDPHQGNRSVALLHFEQGSAVYKPRPLEQHALLDEAVGWLNDRVPGLDLRTPVTVRGEGYGWLEFIGHRWCASDGETDLFYRRQGALLALLYGIDGTDIHFENLIAHGDQPVLVDAETLFHSGLPAATTTGADPAARALESSVHRTGMLPHLLIGDHGALDVSALGRTDGGFYPCDMLRWENIGTDAMRVVRGAAPAHAARNQPLPHASGVADYRAALLVGFRAGYDAITRHRDELLGGDGLLARWAQAPARLIVRPTRFYATLLEESTHPDLLRDALTRDAVFALLWSESRGDAARQRLIEDEIADLWRGDVPLFLHRPSRRAVWTARGTRIDDLLPAPALSGVLAKVAAMSEVDRYDQEWVIAAALAVSGANRAFAGPRSLLVRRPASAVDLTPGRLLTAACGIADEIAAGAVLDAGRANWLCLERIAGRHWAIMPMGASLAEGYCGTALFLAEIGALADADRYTNPAREAVQPLPALLAGLAADPELSLAAGPGLLSGLGGILYTLVRLSTLLDKEIGASIPDALTALGHVVDGLAAESASAAPDRMPADLADGLAGALAAAVLVHDSVDAPEAEKLARHLADLLLPAAGSAGRGPGFTHGDAGIGWALRRYARHPSFAAQAGAHADAGAALLCSALAGALAGLDRLGPFDATAPHLPRPATQPAPDLSWHSGLAGILLAAVDGLGPADPVRHSIQDTDVELCVRLLGGAPPAADLSLRQGDLGALEPLLLLAQRGHALARDRLTRRAGHVLGLIEQQGHVCATPDHVPSPGLLTGSAGIGHALLRLGFPDTVPSVALFEHTGTRHST